MLVKRTFLTTPILHIYSRCINCIFYDCYIIFSSSYAFSVYRCSLGVGILEVRYPVSRVIITVLARFLELCSESKWYRNATVLNRNEVNKIIFKPVPFFFFMNARSYKYTSRLVDNNKAQYKYERSIISVESLVIWRHGVRGNAPLCGYIYYIFISTHVSCKIRMKNRNLRYKILGTIKVPHFFTQLSSMRI